jgi:hypothetical protein
MPIVAVAIVSGTTMTSSGGGEATSSSSVPSQRCHEITPPEPKSVDDQMPITPAPIAMKNSASGLPPALAV